MTLPEKTGLYFNQTPVPLTGVLIRSKVTGHCNKVSVLQRYHNQEDFPIEAIYLFPLEEGSAVTGFRVKIDGRIIVGRVEEREKAFEIYDEAIIDGHGAYLLDQERANVFTASIGNLNPEQIAEVEITYVARLHQEGTGVRVMIPTTVAPRYTPVDKKAQIGETDDDKFNQPRWPKVPYGLRLSLEIESRQKIKSISSPSHTITMHFNHEKAHVELSGEEDSLDKDFVLLLEQADSNKPSSIVAIDAQHKTAMVTFYPDLTHLPEVRSEIIFLLDCSGSMCGNSIQQAKKALQLCIHAMSEGDVFNIICFGSHFESMWPDSQQYNQQTLDEAKTYIQHIDANLGGTEILSPFQSIAKMPTKENKPRQVILLTDGQVSNEQAVIAHCKTERENMRVFGFGIGTGVSEHLVRGVCRASNGKAEFIHANERIEPKVLRMFGRISSPRLTNVALKWGKLKVDQTPTMVPALFSGEAVTVYARFSKRTTGIKNIVLLADTETYNLQIDTSSPVENSAVPSLWAQSKIQELEMQDKQQIGSLQNRRKQKSRKEIINLAINYNLTSSHTSYVAIETREEQNQLTQASKLRQIPIATLAEHRAMRGQQNMFNARSAAPRRTVKSRSYRPSSAPPPVYPSRPSAAPMQKMMSMPPRRSSQRTELRFAAPPSPEPPREKIDKVYALLMTQNADGSFSMSSTLREWLGRTLKQPLKSKEEITAVVVKMLTTHAVEYQKEWQKAVNKAKLFLTKNGNPNVDQLFQG